MKTLRVGIRTVLWETYEVEVEDNFPDAMHCVSERWQEEGHEWPRLDSEIVYESLEEYELVE